MKLVLTAVVVLFVAGCNQYKQGKEGVPLETDLRTAAPHMMGDETLAGPMAAPHMGAPITVSVKVEGVKKAAGGKTIAEIYAEKARLVGKQVVVRGKVVKYNANIMGRNWLHIQDGTGAAGATGAAGTNDLTVTTNDTAAVGSIVLVKGPISLDKDFGAGYKYEVMIEAAKLTVE